MNEFFEILISFETRKNLTLNIKKKKNDNFFSLLLFVNAI